MASEDLISKERPAQKSMDYAFLRAEGIRHLQAFAPTLWTDHNIHDPGITILEALAYGITDLGYRANKPVPDLLASKPGATVTEKDFYSAAEILPCGAVTLNDFRKILIDKDHIRNAWLSRSTDSEQAVFLNVVTKKLSYDTGTKITLNGLYTVQLEFEEDKELGDLNNSIISRDIQVPMAGSTKTYSIEVALPFWDEVSGAWASELSFISNVLTVQDSLTGSRLRPLGQDNDHDYFAVMNLMYNLTISDQVGLTIKITSEIMDPATELPEIEKAIVAILEEITDSSIISEYNRKIMAANEILVSTTDYLNDQRNLCEDFYAFKTSRLQEIAVTATIELAATTDVEQTLAELFFRLHKFISPPIKFYTLAEMLARPGSSPDSIFEGPLLENGFIQDQDLDELKRSDIIYTSDLIRIIVNTSSASPVYASQNKGIIAVKDLSVTNYINNQKITANVKNCLKLTYTDIYKPRLSIGKSTLTVLKDSVEVAYDINKVKTAFNILKEKDKTRKERNSFDLEIPAGTNQFVEEYYSVQNDFPRTYGIGESGLSDTVSDQRKAQAKQLKGFLLFAEQMLANYLSQLAHLKDLYSINAGIDKTYFSQLLTAVPRVSPLLKTTYPANLSILTGKLDLPVSGNSRRNSFLDHLLAQFGEDFTDFALLMYSKYGNPSSDRLTAIKSGFLKNYGESSYNRAKSFNYMGNRLAYFNVETIIDAGISKYRWDLQDESKSTLLINGTLSATQDDAQSMIASVAQLGRYRSNYQIMPQISGKKTIQLVDALSVSIAKSGKQFNLDSEAEAEIKAIMAFLTDVWDTGNVPWLKRRICGLLGIENFRQQNLSGAETEGFHLIENILLRPKANNSVAGKSDHFINISPELVGGTIRGKKDPYSFRLSFVFPNWPERFADADFRKYIEKIIQRETPAHILSEIHWINKPTMFEFERTFKAWLVANATEKDPLRVSDSKNEFIDVLNTLIPAAV